MMREFKIQFILEDECIGNKVFGKLTYSLDEILEGITNEYICEKACESFSPANGVEADFKIIAKRQFTGLQDKNGVDIYDGDICRCWGGTEFNGYYEYNKIYEVKWQGSGFEMMIDDCGYGWNYSSGFEYIEIIGNIYENKELLN